MHRANWTWRLAILAALVSMIGMNAFFVDIVIPAQEADAALHNKPRGNLSDLYPRWLGTRELLLQRRDPYSPEVTEEIQKGLWGRKLDATNPDDPSDEQRFAYPLHIVFFLAPTVNLPFSTVQWLYVIFGAAGMAASIWCWAAVLGIETSGRFTAVSGALLLGSYSVVMALHLQQPLLFVAIVIALALASLARGALLLSGILLAAATIKPQSSLLVIAWLLLWAFADWRRRKALPLSFAATTCLLLGGAQLLQPGWFGQWLNALAAYRRYAQPAQTHLQLFFGDRPGTAAAFAALAGLAWLGWKARHDSPGDDRFSLMTALIFVVGLTISPIWHSYDELLQAPALLLLFHWRTEAWHLPSLFRTIPAIAAAIVAWQWVAAVGLCMVALVSPALARNWQILPWLPVFFSPLAVAAALAALGHSRLRRHKQVEFVTNDKFSPPPSAS